MSSPASHVPYMFNRDFRSSIRLNYNHWLMKEHAGYLLHPKIALDQPELRIADVATGSAIWALELAAELPNTTRIDGFDISSAQYPPQTSRPSNLHLHTHDAFTPFPAEFQGVFDIVHVRLMLCLVNDPDAPLLLSNLVSLLKPDGSLQWFEPLPVSARAVHTDVDGGALTMEKLAVQWHKPTQKSTYAWVEGMPGLFQEHGLTVIAADKLRFKELYRHIWLHSQLAGLEDTVADTRLVGTETREMVKQFMASLIEEGNQGAACEVDFTCVVGQRRV